MSNGVEVHGKLVDARTVRFSWAGGGSKSVDLVRLREVCMNDAGWKALCDLMGKDWDHRTVDNLRGMDRKPKSARDLVICRVASGAVGIYYSDPCAKCGHTKNQHSPTGHECAGCINERSARNFDTAAEAAKRAVQHSTRAAAIAKHRSSAPGKRLDGTEVCSLRLAGFAGQSYDTMCTTCKHTAIVHNIDSPCTLCLVEANAKWWERPQPTEL